MAVSFRTTTWLNREGWNDTIAGEKPTLSFAEIEAANRRAEESRKRNAGRDSQLVESRRRQLGMTT
jgi:hypothetical protein